MSDPQPARLKDKPRRAEALQPDAPAQGDSAAPSAPTDRPNNVNTGDSGLTGDASGPPHSKKAEKALREQSENALGNVKEGYD